MIGRIINLKGRRFGRLKVLGFEFVRGKAYWACECECGNLSTVRGDKLTTGRIVSCGCARADRKIRIAAANKVNEADRQRRAAKGGRIFVRNRRQGGRK